MAASQYTSIRYTQRLAEIGIAASAGTTGDSYDNALAETINGLDKTELIKRRGPWRTVDHFEYATAEYIDWFNHRRLYEYCRDIPPVEPRPPTTLNNEPSRPLSSHTSKSPDSPGRFSRGGSQCAGSRSPLEEWTLSVTAGAGAGAKINRWAGSSNRKWRGAGARRLSGV